MWGTPSRDRRVVECVSHSPERPGSSFDVSRVERWEIEMARRRAHFIEVTGCH